MRKKILFFLVGSFFAIIHSFGQKSSCNKGMIEICSNIDADTTNCQLLWFKDSAMILEMKLFYNYSNNDTTYYKGYDVFKYTYIDLTTLLCQDYYHFSDTAQVVYNYKLNSLDEFPFRDMFSGRKQYSSSKLIILPDTNINGKKTKRLLDSFNSQQHNYRQNTIYYLEMENCRSNLFHINLEAEKMVPLSWIFRIETNVLSPRQYSSFDEFKIISNSLTNNVERIFNCWKQNSLETKLPLLSIKDVAQKQSYVPLHLKNDPAFMRLFKKE